MKEPHIRPLEKADIVQVSDVLVAAFKSFLGGKYDELLPGHFSPEILAETLTLKDKFGFTESGFFVAEYENRIIGAIKVTAGRNGLGVLDYVGVDPAANVCGVGALLMKKAEAFWKKHKQRKITTCVSAHNKKALLYYIKNDFIPEGYCRDHFHEGLDEVILGRFLA